MARSASIAGGRARPAALGGLVALTAVAALATLGWQRYQAGSAVGSSPGRAALAEVATAAAPSAQPVAAPPAEEKVVEEDEAAAEGEAAADPDKGHAVPRTPTPLDEVAIANVLRQAHELELGSPPTDARGPRALAAAERSRIHPCRVASPALVAHVCSRAVVSRIAGTRPGAPHKANISSESARDSTLRGRRAAAPIRPRS